MNERSITRERVLAFGRHLMEEEHSRGTVEKYLRDVRQLAAWLGGREVTKEGLTRWKEALGAQGRAPATINSKLAAAHAFLAFLGWTDCRVKFLKVQRQLFRDTARELTRRDYDSLIAAARRQGRERLTLVMETICATGIRVSEVRDITVEAARAGRAEIALKGKIRVILLPGKLCRKLLHYAQKQKIVSGEIFLTRNGTSLPRRQIWAEMKALCQRAGVEPTRVFPHNLRHLFATAFYRACKDIAKLADLLGHSSLETTRIYLLTSGEEHRRELDRLGLVR